MNIQQQEQWDYEAGMDTEQRNAHAWASMNRKSDDAFKIKEAVAAGKHVIIEEGTDYCPYTDAIMGSRRYLVSVHETREEAEAALKQAAQDDPDPEINVYILPYKPVPVPPPAYDRDEIPF